MTDRMAALATLSLHDVPERQAAFDDFYRRYRDDPLIIDKWFALQATMPGAGDARPRSRAHRASGLLDDQSQSRALADRLVRAGQPDPVQPRRRRRLRVRRRHACWRSIRTTRRSPRGMTTAFRSWRALEAAAARAREAALQRIAGAPNLSRDVARHRRSARSLNLTVERSGDSEPSRNSTR